MDFVLNCKVKKIGDLQTGVSKSGNTWSKKNILVEETGAQYNKEVYFSIMGNLCDLQISEGDDITVHLEVSAREYQGKYFNDVRCFKIDIKKTDIPF